MMDLKTAISYAKDLSDPGANPVVFAEAASNGPKHNAVVHVTFGEPKRRQRDGNDATPSRPRPYTVS